MIKERCQGHVCIFTANVIFGIYIPISKTLIGEYVSGQVLTLFRFWGAAILFTIASLFVKDDKFSFKDLMLAAFFGLFGIALNQGLFIYGLMRTSPVDASVIVTGTPLMVMIIAALFANDPITRRKGIGVGFGAAGAIWLILSTGRIAQSSGTFDGDMLILASGLATAIYYSLSKPLTSRHSPIVLMKWMFIFSSIFFIPAVPSILGATEAFKGDFDGRGFAMLAYVVCGATFITYMLIAMSIKRMRPTTVAMYNYVQPFISSLLAISLGQDSFSIEKCGAAVLVFWGVYLVTSSHEIKPIGLKKI